MKPTEQVNCLTHLCEVLEEWEATEQDARNLAADLVTEFLARAENRNEAAYDAYQARLMESGGPDDSAYRRDMKLAGRGHLLK